jgi:dTDP-glucose pyrophosphorylase
MNLINKSKFSKNIIDLSYSVQDCVRLLQSLQYKIIFVANKKKLYGSITDNDLRNYYLGQKKNSKNKNEIDELVNKKTFFLIHSNIHKYSQSFLKKKLIKFKFIPILNKKHEIMSFISLDEKIKNTNLLKKINVIIMAGGYGKRLRPLTQLAPKPTIVINKDSNLISLMNNLKISEVDQFFITTHYLSKIIKSEIRKFWLEEKKVNYYYEKKILGTFGSTIAVIKKYKLKSPILVCNADIVTNLNFSSLIEYYYKNNCKFLICNKILQNSIPYGVIVPNKDKKTMKSFQEKPTYTKFINAGIYMLDPNILEKYFLKIKKLSIVDVIEKLLSIKIKCHIFPINEFWCDMGTHEDLDFLKKIGKV